MVEGRVIAAKNTRVNPLRFVSLQAPLLFINGENEKEVRWALKQPQPSKIILTHGSPFALMKDHDRVIYFDQSAAMVKRFAIRCTPTRMTQQGEALLIETVALSKEAE